MKRLLFLTTVVLASLFSLSANAQGGNGYKNAIGIRGGWGADLSYQRYLAPSSRIEGTLGFNRYGFSAGATYQWLFDLPVNTSGIWQWYAGAGAGMGAWSNNDFKEGFSLGVLAQAGIEYTFPKIPLLLSVDYRPGFYFTPDNEADWTGIAFGVRYCF